MTIYSKEFQPTYLYIKQHIITGKLYFGKTTQIEIEDSGLYKGSGTHWKSHINKHGKQYVVTLWKHLFENIFDLVAFSISFSNKLNIVNSHSWLNIIPENGLDGSPYGNRRSTETRKKISEKLKGIPLTPNRIKNMSKPRSDKARQNMSVSKIGKPSNRKGTTNSEDTKLKISLTKTILFDFLTPNGFVIEQIGMKELCIRFNLNYSTLKGNFRNGKSYKGFTRL